MRSWAVRICTSIITKAVADPCASLGYLYFHAAPNAQDFHEECIKRVKNLHTADCLRANKSTMAWGLEARVPFLDKKFLEVAMNVDAKYKMFSKGAQQQIDAEGKPMMEKVRHESLKLTKFR